MNVFLVLSPLQLINAVEAKHHFATKDNMLIILRHSSLGYPISMFKRLVEREDWEHVMYLSTYDDEKVKRLNIFYWTYLSFRVRQRLNTLAASFGPVQRLFVGQYHEPIARHFSNILIYKDLCLIDDGTSTLETNNERKAFFGGVWRGKLKSKLKHVFLGLDDRQADAVTFFTAYDIETLPGDEVIANHYRYFRQCVNQTPIGKEVWFLGEPLVLDGYITEATYLDYLEEFRQRYRGQPFIYLPHGREQRKDVERVGDYLGCEIRRFDVPIEFAIRDLETRPREVASFISSALPNCRIIFGSTIQLTSLYLAPKHLIAQHDFVMSIYDHFRQMSGRGFKVLELPSDSQAG